MEIQRLRNLTTGRLHTEMGHVYEDLEYITGISDLTTQMLPNLMRAVEPWLRGCVIKPRYWNNEYDQNHTGQEVINPMSETERADMLKRYSDLMNSIN